MHLFRQENNKATEAGTHPNPYLASIVDGLKKMCEGDLTVHFDLPEKDPLYPVARHLNELSRKNFTVLRDLSMTLNKVVYLGLESGNALNSLAGQFGLMTESTKQIAAAIDQICQSVTNLADSSTKTSEQTQIGKQAMDQTSGCVETVSQETSKAQNRLEDLTGQVEALHKATASIDSLVEVVKSVSDQTNLLSLNAAIEAARAGEHGRGFAVVAAEVKKLADQSRQSVDKISDQLNHIQTDVNTINNAFQEMGHSFHSNNQAVATANDSVQNLATVFAEIGDAVQNLAPIAEEQSATFEEVSATVRDIDTTTSALNTTTQNCNATILDVLMQVNGLRTEVSSFKIPFSADEILDLAKTDHLLWKTRVDYMLHGLDTLDAHKASNHHICRLGVWYFGEGKERFGHYAEYKNLDGLHEQFHTSCAQAIRLYQEHKLAEAQAAAADVDRLSGQIMELLDMLKLRVKEPQTK